MKMGKKLGKGTFLSKSVNRDKKWKDNLMLEAKTGEQICTILYDKKRYYNDQDKKKIYNTFQERINIRKKISDINQHCKELQQDTEKERCLKNKNKLDKKLDEVNNNISHLLR
jgi:hypothetical protein